MLQHTKPLRVAHLAIALLATAAACLLLSACGSSSPGNARSLLHQTFSGSHRVDSGQLSFAISLQPSGSSTLTSPISLSLSGPFQSRGTGKLPASDFTVAISAEGHTGSLSILSTGTRGYVTMSGVSYQLPASDFQKLESSFSSIASSGGSSSSSKSSVLSKLGINPLDWLNNPRVVGSSTIGGAATTHIRASVNVPALLRDLSTFMQKAASLGVSGASSLSGGLSSTTQQKLAGALQKPSFDLWTGNSDKTVRRLEVGLRFPLSGEISTLLDGAKAAGLDLTLQYGQLNQPQTITAPSKVEPYSIFSKKLDSLLQALESSVSGATGSGTSTSSGTSTTSAGTATTGSGSSTPAGITKAYSQCVTKAGTNVLKLQKCAAKASSSGG